MTATPSPVVLTEPAGAISLWLTSVGPDGLPFAVWAMPERRIVMTAHAGDGSILRTTLTDSPGLTALDHVQPLLDGRWLMVDSSAEWTMTAGATRNAVVVAADGTEEFRACLGDDVSQVVAAAGGAIWTGYGDDATTGETPTQLVGAAGLLRWSPDLAETWPYDGVSGGSMIFTCDAVTLDGERALAIVDAVRADAEASVPRLLVVVGDRVTDVACPVAGAWGVIASDDRIAILGSADDDLAVTIGRLAGNDLVEQSATRLDLDPETVTARVCRRDTLHVFEGTHWSTVTVADLTGDA